MLFDAALEEVGSMGAYQIVLFLMLGAMEFLAVDSIAMNFIGGQQEHWCRIDALVDQNFTHDQQKYIAIPDGASCSRFSLNFSQYSLSELVGWNRSRMTDNLTSGDWVDCERGYVYDQTQYHSSITSEWDLVCGRGWMVQMISTVYMAGRLVGSITAGAVSDKIGRRKTIFIFHSVRIAGGCLCLAPEYAGFAVGRFLMAFGTTGSNLAAFVLITEVCGAKYRGTFGGPLWQLTFSLGYMTMPWVAYFVRDHLKFQAVYTFAPFIHLLYIAFVDESPRWLVSRGRDQEAIKILGKIANINHRHLPSNIDFKEEREKAEKLVEAQEKGTLSDIFRKKNTSKHLGVCWLIWFTNSLMYYGLALNAGTLAGDIYLNTFLMGAVEIPANIIALVLLSKAGRRYGVGGGLLVGGVALVISIPFILQPDNDGFQKAATALSIVGKAGVTTAFTSSYVITAELFPTGVRNVAVGSASMFARISGMASPYMGQPLKDAWAPLPPLIFAVFALTSGSLAFILPETRNIKLPETMEEANQLGNRRKMVAPQIDMIEIDAKKVSANNQFKE